MAEQTHEYLVVRLSPSQEEDSTAQLNAAAADGWRLATSYSGAQNPFVVMERAVGRVVTPRGADAFE